MKIVKNLVKIFLLLLVAGILFIFFANYTTVTSVSQSPVTAYLPLPAGIK